jgi:hypothetical protein
MAASAEAVARLSLDAKGFDNQARSSFREFNKQLTTVKDATDAAMRGAEALQKVFIKSLFGTAVIGAANLVADTIRDVGNQLSAAGQAAEQANQKLNQLGQITGLEQGRSAAGALQESLKKTNDTLAELDASGGYNLKNLVASLSGAKDVMKDLAETTQSQIDLTLKLAAAEEARRQKERAGMTDQERQRADLEDRLTKEAKALTSQITDPKARAEAEASLAQARNTQLSEFDTKGADAADRKARDEQVKSDDARRSRDMKEFQDALDEQNEETARQSAKALEKALEDLEIQAQMVELNTERLDLQGQMGDLQKERSQEVARADAESLGASTAGRQALTSAQRKQAARNRQDNFRFEQENLQRKTDEMNAQSQAQANELMALRDLRSREGSGAMDRTGRSVADRIAELEKSDLIDRSFGAKRFSTAEARRRIAEEDAARNNPSMRETSADKLEAIDSRLEKIRELLNKNLETLTNFNTSN